MKLYQIITSIITGDDFDESILDSVCEEIECDLIENPRVMEEFPLLTFSSDKLLKAKIDYPIDEKMAENGHFNHDIWDIKAKQEIEKDNWVKTARQVTAKNIHIV